MGHGRVPAGAGGTRAAGDALQVGCLCTLPCVGAELLGVSKIGSAQPRVPASG